MNRQSYQVITDRIIDLLEQGTVPWRKPWGGEEYHPKSLITDRKYRGINAFMLAVAGFESPYWLTFKQARVLNGSVKRGERGFPCVFWNWHDVEDPESGEIRELPFLKHYTVFNVAQCDGIKSPQIEPPAKKVDPIGPCESIVLQMSNKPEFNQGSHKAYYCPKTDRVGIPFIERFESAEAYYSTLFHEIVHSTGHKKRLGRDEVNGPIVFGSPSYSREELVAEMGSTYLCGHAGIENAVIENSAAYINGWLGKLRKDSKLVVQAASQAQKAADYILGEKTVIAYGKGGRNGGK